jgi:hypothetical protein
MIKPFGNPATLEGKIKIGTCGRGLKACENRMLKRLFRPKRDEAIGGWRKLHNKGLNNL